MYFADRPKGRRSASSSRSRSPCGQAVPAASAAAWPPWVALKGFAPFAVTRRLPNLTPNLNYLPCPVKTSLDRPRRGAPRYRPGRVAET